MIETKVLGISGEGRILCLNCAKILYGSSLEQYVKAGNLQQFGDEDRTTYSSKGLLCDDCLNWIFPPKKVEDPWWQVEPDRPEHLRLLAPFADFLGTIQVDVVNLRNLSAKQA